MVQRIKNILYTAKYHYKLTKRQNKTKICRIAGAMDLEGTGFPKVIFLFNTFHILCRDEGKTFLGFGEDLHKIK